MMPTTSAMDSPCDSVAAEDLFCASEEVVSVTSRSVQVEQTRAILDSLASSNTQNDIQQYIEAAESHWNSIRAQMADSKEMAAAAWEHLARVKAYLAALKSKPQLPQVSDMEQREPANKKATQQRHFRSTKKKPVKRKAEASLSKPDDREKSFLLESLSGNVEVVYTTAAGTEHDYAVGPGNHVAFEHSY